MTFIDLMTTALGNLWRMKLRSILTLSGIVIAIAAFVSMLSFGSGMQKNITDQFDKFGLLSIIQVTPSDADETDSTTSMPLDNTAIEFLENIPGVALVYPFESLDMTVAIGDSQQTITAQALPFGAVQTKLYSNLVAGSLFSSDSSKQVLISEKILESLGFETADSIINKQIIVSIKTAQIDSGVIAMIKPAADIILKRSRELRSDSIRNSDYIQRVVREELSQGLQRFIDGFMNNRTTILDTLTVSGVLEARRGGHIRFKDMIIPVATARRFSSSGFSGDMTEIFASIQSGRLFSKNFDSPQSNYSRMTVLMESGALYKPIKDSIKTAGFKVFSFAEQFDEMRNFFRYFNLALGLVGLIALMTASLGIINTMVMSITERRREIGVWMSLGADVWDIKRLFLVESGLIGFIGAVGGVIFGWIISRIGSFIAKTFMENEGVPPMEMFQIPLWLVLLAVTFGVIVSLLAGYYPASRAAKVDPVASLKNE